MPDLPVMALYFSLWVVGRVDPPRICPCTSPYETQPCSLRYRRAPCTQGIPLKGIAPRINYLLKYGARRTARKRVIERGSAGGANVLKLVARGARTKSAKVWAMEAKCIPRWEQRLMQVCPGNWNCPPPRALPAGLSAISPHLMTR